MGERTYLLYRIGACCAKHFPRRGDNFHGNENSRCGISQGTDLVKKGGTKSLKGLKKTLFTKAARWVFEMDVVESTDNTLYLDFH